MMETYTRAIPRNILLEEIRARAVKIAMISPMMNVMIAKGIVNLIAPSINGPMDVDAISWSLCIRSGLNAILLRNIFTKPFFGDLFQLTVFTHRI